MKNKIYLLIPVITLIFSCSKFLETVPDNRTELDSATKIAELLTSAYPRGNYIPFTESASDNAGDKGISRNSGDQINQNPWRFQDVEDRNQDSPTFYWYAAYKAIAAANQALEAIEKLGNTKELNSLKGEALLTRAYAHHMLVILFSPNYEPETADQTPGIPYVTQPEKEVFKKYERGNVRSVYNQIEKDLLEGIPLLDDNRYKVPKYHFTRAAAHAFATRFYLFMQNYEKAAEHGNLVTSINPTELIRPINSRDFAGLEYFNIQKWYSSFENPTNLLLVEAMTSWGRNLPSNRFGLTSSIIAELVFGRNVTKGQFGYPIFGGTEYSYHIPKFREHFVSGNLNAEYGTIFNMIPLFTVDELLLNRAEAYARIKKFDLAISDLNMFISKKVFYSPDLPVYEPKEHNIDAQKINAFYESNNLEENIIQVALDFKRREFLFEGLRWFDIIRHKIVVTHQTFDEKETYSLGANSPMRQFQLPPEVILSGVQPNPR